MNKYLFTAAVLLACSLGAPGQTKYSIGVIGSSTAMGVGASIPDSSWVNLTKAYYEGLKEIDTIYNRAIGGTFTGNGLPDPNPADTGSVTAILSLHPDVVIVSYVSNDAAGDIPLATTMQNLRTIYQSVIAAGKVCYITTPHPRNGLNAGQDSVQIWTRDSVLAEFPGFSLNFWDGLVASDGVSINPVYNFDGVHVNDAGHQVLFQVVKNANILSSFIPLALAIDHFTATMEQQEVLLQWASQATAPALFDIQRSPDGLVWTDLGQENSSGSLAGALFSWPDADPLPGTSYYRIKTFVEGDVSFSTVAAVLRPVPDFAIANVYMQQGSSMLVVDIQSAVSRTLSMNVVDVNGAVVSRQVVAAATPSSTIELSLSGLARGMYFLRVSTPEGKVATKRFLKM